MTLPKMVFRSLRQHALSTSITSFSIALAAALLVSVWVVRDQSRETFTRVDAGFDAVLGARGSKLQLVLNSIFHLEASPGNISAADYEEIARHPGVALAVPIAVGDNYRGYRLVGTMPALFTESEFAPGKKYELEDGGRWFESNRREAVIGSFVARKLGLEVGDTFHPYHGLIFDEKSQHAETYLVVGVMKPSNTPADRVLWIPLAGLQRMSGHDPKTASDLSAVLVKLRSPSAGFMLDLLYNKQGNRLTLAWPIGGTMAQLLDKIGWFDRVLGVVAILVGLVATGSVVASIYNSVNERRREMAILRALGAHRRTLLAAVVGESVAITAIGLLVGGFLYMGIMTAVSSVVRAETGVVLDPFLWHPVFLIAPAGLLALSAAAGLIPALKAYRTEVADYLTPLS